jgi:hypothetical protein
MRRVTTLEIVVNPVFIDWFQEACPNEGKIQNLEINTGPIKLTFKSILKFNLDVNINDDSIII